MRVLERRLVARCYQRRGELCRKAALRVIRAATGCCGTYLVCPTTLQMTVAITENFVPPAMFKSTFTVSGVGGP